MASSRAFDDLVARAHRDPALAALILSGSLARAGMATERSDYDAYIITDSNITDSNRYSFAWASVLLDRRDGEITRPAWDAGRLLPMLRRVLADGDPGTQRDLFGDLAVAARGAGLGHVLEAWGPDLVLLSA